MDRAVRDADDNGIQLWVSSSIFVETRHSSDALALRLAGEPTRFSPATGLSAGCQPTPRSATHGLSLW